MERQDDIPWSQLLPVVMYNINSHISEKTGVAPADLKFGDFHGLHLQFALESEPEGEINEMSYLTKTRDAQKRLLERVNRIREDEFAGRTYVDSENNERRDAKRCTVFQPGQWVLLQSESLRKDRVIYLQVVS